MLRRTFNTAITSIVLSSAFLLPSGNEASAQDRAMSTTSIRASSLSPDKLANNLYLAHVKSRDPITNMNTGRGLFHLTQQINEKTALNPKGFVSIDIENNDLSFYPVLYWPVTEREATLTDAAQRKLQDYINNGGMIIFDIQSEQAERQGTLKRMLGNVSIGALEKAEDEHTLNRTFYLFSKNEDHFHKGDTWVEQKEFDNPNAVSSIIIARAGWAQAWAGITTPLGSKQHERSLREGINMIMYSLTGNYKQDLDHNKAVLEKIDLRKKQ